MKTFQQWLNEHKIYNDVTDSHAGHIYGKIKAEEGELAGNPGNEKLGHIAYSADMRKYSHPKRVRIEYIHVEEKHRRKGIARQMMDHLRSEFPHYKIDWGGTTRAGAAFRKAYYTPKK